MNLVDFGLGMLLGAGIMTIIINIMIMLTFKPKGENR